MVICAVIVTYNRLDKLKRTLAAYNKQTRKVDKIIVVDNASEEDTKEYLRSWLSGYSTSEKFVVTLDFNLGGSAGFYYGIKKALTIGFDWLWLADDDAYPRSDSFQKLEEAINKTQYKAICGKVYNDTTIQCFHRRRVKKGLFKVKEISSSPADYKEESFDVDIFSFVGCCLAYDVVNSCGLPCKDYFIWFDDTEYAYRVHKYYKILCVPSIGIYHDSDESNGGLSWKSYYGVRNKLDLCKRHFSKIQLFYEICFLKFRIFKNFFTNKPQYKLLKTAYKDYKHHKFGISEVYKPGTKIK